MRSILFRFFLGRWWMVRKIKIIIEKHSDCYLAYPLGVQGVVVGQGDTYEEALADIKSAISCHIETFGPTVLDEENDVLAVYIAETMVHVEESK